MSKKTIANIIKGQDLAIAAPDSTVQEAVDIMRGRGIGAILIVKSGKLKGIFTERDVVRLFSSPKEAKGHTMEEVMTPDPDTISTRTSTSEALQMMAVGGYRHLPVVDKSKLVGIVSRRDFF